MISRWNVRWRNRLCFMFISCRNWPSASLDPSHCIHSQTYLVYGCILRSWIAGIKVCHRRSKQSHWPSLLQCMHTRKSVSSFWV